MMQDDTTHATHELRIFDRAPKRAIGAMTLGILSISANAAAGPRYAVDVSAGQGHACLVTSCGELRCWGANASGQAVDYLPKGPTIGTYDYPDVERVSAGRAHTCVKTGSAIASAGFISPPRQAS